MTLKGRGIDNRDYELFLVPYVEDPEYTEVIQRTLTNNQLFDRDTAKWRPQSSDTLGRQFVNQGIVVSAPIPLSVDITLTIPQTILGQNINRQEFWVHVIDPNLLVIQLRENGVARETYNIPGGSFFKLAGFKSEVFASGVTNPTLIRTYDF